MTTGAAIIRRVSTTATSKLRSKYNFTPPPSLQPKPLPQAAAKPTSKTPYRPPSSLETPNPPLRSELPFDFRFSYTESSAKVRPIGLREPKYSPFGPGRLDRVWTGVCAPVLDPRELGVHGADVEGQMEERRRLMRENVQGEPLTGAERKAIVERCQRHRTKRQINLGWC